MFLFALLLGCGPNYTEMVKDPLESLKMVRVEAGEIRTSANINEGWNDRESQERTIIVDKDFEISSTEITCEQWIRIMDQELDKRFECRGLTHPIGGISWTSALEFCNRLSKEMGYEAVYTIVKGSTKEDIPTVSWNRQANGFRLPTGAEWEFAARGRKNQFSFSGSSEASETSWYAQNTSSPNPVGLKAPNSLGLYDMSGNLREWTWDEKEKHDIDFNQGVSVMRNFRPQDRQARGGSFMNEENSLLVGNLYWYHPNYLNNDTGFRIARNYTKPEPE